MKNLAAIVTPEAIKSVLEQVLITRPTLQPSTKFHLIYKNEAFPPKEIVRMAARIMGIRNLEDFRLVGGKSTNRHLLDKGYEIVQHSQWQRRFNTNVVSVQNEQKIARLTFNSNGWQKPSGWRGKSRQKSSYETSNGYGHEEWLLDFSKIIQGFHYAYLEPINRGRSKHEGKFLDIFLFSINSETNERFWVGKLKNAEVINTSIAEKAKEIYHKRGWIKEMENDLRCLDIDPSKLNTWMGTSLFNIRFKPANFERFPANSYIAKADKSVSSYHYVLLNVNQIPQIEQNTDGQFILGRCNPTKQYSGSTIKRMFEERLIEYPALHDQISRGLERHLKKAGYKVFIEQQTGYRTSIDIYAVKGKHRQFYEIKTYNDPKTCIRLALGQIIEYAYFPNRKLADELYIVTPHLITNNSLVEYILHIREKLTLPLHYICFDNASNQILQRI